jgi:hypothetical protein
VIRTEGKVYDAVKEILQEKGLNTDTLQIVSFGNMGTWRDIMLNGEHIGSYVHRSGELTLLNQEK